MLTYFTNRTQTDYINIPLQKKNMSMSNFLKKTTLSHIILYLRRTFYLASLVNCKESQKSTRLHIFKFKSFSLDLWTHMVLDLWTQNPFVCTGNEGYVSVVYM